MIDEDVNCKLKKVNCKLSPQIGHIFFKRFILWTLYSLKPAGDTDQSMNNLRNAKTMLNVSRSSSTICLNPLSSKTYQMVCAKLGRSHRRICEDDGWGNEEKNLPMRESVLVSTGKRIFIGVCVKSLREFDMTIKNCVRWAECLSYCTIVIRVNFVCHMFCALHLMRSCSKGAS